MRVQQANWNVWIYFSNVGYIDVIGPQEQTALHMASARGYQDIVRTLLDNGAKIEASDTKGDTALHLAKSFGKNAVEQL